MSPGTTYAHDILNGVSSITGIGYWVTASLESGATLIADNTGGSSLAAINAGNSLWPLTLLQETISPGQATVGFL